MHNTYRIALICEYLEQRYNLEFLFRSKKQKGKAWSLYELERIAASLLNVLSYLQSVGVCHRDIKPANIFVLPKCQVKLIDFGESKEFLLDKEADYTMATIRGTPQYLSPILWKAHVVEGKSRQARHSVYKSDVFSAGLVLIQLASMDDVTGFNQKTHKVDGAKLIEKAIGGLPREHSKSFVALLKQMLKFEEIERPTFIELANEFLQEPFGKDLKEFPRLKRSEGDKDLEEKLNEVEDGIEESKEIQLQSLDPHKLESAHESLEEKREKSKKLTTNEQSTEQLLTQAELFKAYAKSNELFLSETDLVYWFEYGGNSIGEFNVNHTEGKWKIIGKYKNEFSAHFTLVFAELHGYFLLGPNIIGTCIQYKDRKLTAKQNMLQEKCFFCGIYLKERIYIFGGYDIIEKQQLKICEIYDVKKNHWIANPKSLNQARSQAAICIMDKNTIYIFGGYNKQSGTLGSIEKYLIKEEIIKLLKLGMPNPLRRFSAIKIAPTKILLLGGLQKLSKESDSVYCVDLEGEETIEKLDKLSKGGVIEHPIVADTVGNLHLFIENCSGTAAPYHITYTFLEYS
eukprot:TRINITY_DN5331_c0_g1_i4.p1 TRINITY_DN5331_c0_g1~~TRINITY_DN5331_c0_g1_i4.p1  ORF type:complete len:571 (-),score=170.12 TRINITY_DN5331_c0_g1_i4:162-1874(-)